MRWPLKYQIMIPMSCLVVTTLILLSVANAWLAGRRVRQQIETQLRDIAETLTRSAFPLTGAVLAQMRGLSGVDFLVAAEDGTLIASSGDEPVPVEILAQPERSLPREITLSSRVRVNDSTFFHAALLLQRPFAHEEEGYLHFFYPEVNYQQAWWDAVLPPFLLGISALFLLVLLSLAIAQRVTRPIRRLRDGLEQIADGKFAQVIIPPRNDELQDLAVSVNRLAEKLSRYEEQVRRAERLRTLNQLGGGMAHQLRNSVTGCRMAVEIRDKLFEPLVSGKRDGAGLGLPLSREIALSHGGSLTWERRDEMTCFRVILPLIEKETFHGDSPGC